MKHKLIYFLPFILMLGAGCLKHNDDTNPQLNVPIGIFNGTFKVLHINAAHTGYDTTQKVNLTLAMDLTTGFSVTGDTSTVHAGSHGDFALDAINIRFADNSGTSSKIQLNDLYDYTYDGSNFIISRSYADTLGYLYTLKKQ